MEKREGSGLRGLLPVTPASGHRLSPPSPFFAALGSGRLGQGLGFWVGAEGEGDGEESRGRGLWENEKMNPRPLLRLWCHKKTKICKMNAFSQNFLNSVTISVKNFD